jgi:LacI family transcriptional regulator
VRVAARLTSQAVVINDREGIRMATRHLLAYGHKRLAFVGGDASLSTGRNRLAGFEDALSDEGLKPAAVALGAPRPEFARHAVTSMMSVRNRPTGLVLGSAELTLGALQALRALHLDWPRDVSVVGYHDPAWFELAVGGITTVRLPVQDIASTATSVLLSRALGNHPDGEHDDQSANIEFAPTLILRGSTAPYVG